MNKIIDLSDLKTTITVKVGTRSFDIARIVLNANELYGEYMQMCGKYMIDLSELNNGLDDLEKNRKTGKQVDEWAKKITARSEQFIKDKVKYIDMLMTTLLLENGYDYDQEWWNKHSDYKDRELFIEQVMQKDVPEDKKKESISL